MINFSELKNNRKDTFAKLTEKLNKLAANSFDNKDDDTFWQPTVGKDGNGYAVVRFLPPPQGEESDFIRIFSHGFQGPAGWYIENSLTTPTKEHPQGTKDPVSEMNTKLWHSGREEDKLFVSGDPKAKPRKQGSKRKLTFVANVYIVVDPENKQNEGKVFRYRFGKKIYDKIVSAVEPTSPDVVSFNPFDLWEGANFKIKIRNADGYRNYDQSEWDLVDADDKGITKKPRGKLLADDDKLETIWKSEYSLQELITPDKFKSYNELKARLLKIMGQDVDQDEDKHEVPQEETRQPRALKVRETKPEVTKDETPPWVADDSTDKPTEDSGDEMSWFRDLADQD